MTHLKECYYEAAGQVIHVGEAWWAVDFGLLMFDETPPRDIRLGSWVRGEILVGIDCFVYREEFAHQAGAPALIYDWEIKKIEIDTAPRVETKPNWIIRDRSRQGWREIAETDAWNDDGGSADYLLHCRRLPGPPRRTCT